MILYVRSMRPNLLRLVLLSSLVYFCIDYIAAQGIPLYSENINYLQYINPAMTGSEKFPMIDLSYKQYWIGTTNSPGTMCLDGSLRLGSFNFYNPRMMLSNTGIFSPGRMGLGGLLIRESEGPLDSYSLTACYAYYIPLNYSNTELSLGLSLHLLYYDINENMLDPIDKGDPKLTSLDQKHVSPESGFGIYFHNSQFRIGASANDLFLSSRPYDNVNSSSNKRDFFFHTSYKFFLKYFDFEPSLYMAKIDFEPVYYLGQAKLIYKDYNWIALSYKSTESILVSIGFRIHHIYLSYIFDHSISSMGSYFGSSHEILLGVNISSYEPEGIKKRRGKIL
jgi:type IX secretion system PorP/SprF family membrane protein